MTQKKRPPELRARIGPARCCGLWGHGGDAEELLVLPGSSSLGPSSQLEPWEDPEEAAVQGRFSSRFDLPWGPHTNSSHGSRHSPSGRVNSRKVGRDTTVCEMVCTGSNTQVTSLGRQDLMQRTVSVFSWRSLRGTTAQEADGKVGTATGIETQVPGGAAGVQAGGLSQRWLHQGSTVASAAQLLGEDAAWPFLQTGPGPHSGFHLPWLWISEALLFAKPYRLNFSFHNCRQIHPLDKRVLKACWVRGTRDAKPNVEDVVPPSRSPGSDGSRDRK